MHRIIYLLKYPAQPKQRGHFAIWIPSHEDCNIGKTIQVLGTPFTGFGLEFQRGYDITKTLPMPAMIELGAVASDNVRDACNKGPDATPLDRLEAVAKRVTPPGPSRNPLIVDGVRIETFLGSLLFFGWYSLTISGVETEQTMPRVDCRVY
jgi:hypothetical protein